MPRTAPESEERGFTITEAHRACLRAIERGGVNVGYRHYLYQVIGAGLAEWLAVGSGATYVGLGVALTNAGRALLAAHDALDVTRRIERPRLESKPLPAGWQAHQFEFGATYEHKGTPRVTSDGSACVAVMLGNYGPLDEVVADVRDTLALLEYLQHERAVAAQDG